MPNMSDPYDMLANVASTMQHYAEKAERWAADAKVRAEVWREAEQAAEDIRMQAEEWRRRKPPAEDSPLVVTIDDAAYERANESLNHAWAIDTAPILDDEDGRRQMVSLIIHAVAKPAWRARTRGPEQTASLVLDDAARERAYAVALDPTLNLDGGWAGEREVRALVDKILDAVTGAGEENRG